jgi:hypothetical protein
MPHCLVRQGAPQLGHPNVPANRQIICRDSFHCPARTGPKRAQSASARFGSLKPTFQNPITPPLQHSISLSKDPVNSLNFGYFRLSSPILRKSFKHRMRRKTMDRSGNSAKFTQTACSSQSQSKPVTLKNDVKSQTMRSTIVPPSVPPQNPCIPALSHLVPPFTGGGERGRDAGPAFLSTHDPHMR